MSCPHHLAASDRLRSQAISGLELALLQALCNTGSPTHLDRALRELESHQWSNPEYGVVYQALALVRGKSPQSWRNELPAQATRMGFPDVEWEIYLGEKADLQKAHLSELLRELKAETAKQP